MLETKACLVIGSFARICRSIFSPPSSGGLLKHHLPGHGLGERLGATDLCGRAGREAKPCARGDASLYPAGRLAWGTHHGRMPTLVAAIIRMALERGWDPQQVGNPFTLKGCIEAPCARRPMYG